MPYPTHDNVSAQVTGTTNPDAPAPQYTNQQQYSSGIESAPIHPPTDHGNSEKSPFGSPDPQPIGTHNGMPPPQQSYQQQPNPSHTNNYQHDNATQNILSQQQQGQGRNNYQMATPLASLQQSPAPADCPICGAREMTRTEYVTGGTTHLSALLFCCCLCLGCIPYLATWFKDCEHRCGICGVLLAIWKRSQRTEVLAHGRM